jgi:archaellum component FlaC
MTGDGGMPREYSTMSRSELESELRRLKADLEDLEETVAFHLTNTAAHISGSSVARAEEEREELKKQIAEVEKLLSGI